MASAEHTPENADVSEATLVAALHAQGRKWLKEGIAAAEVKEAMLRAGLHEDDAAELLDQLQKSLAEARAEAGRRNMLYGVIWLAGAASAIATIIRADLPAANYVLAGAFGLFGAALVIRSIGQLVLRPRSHDGE